MKTLTYKEEIQIMKYNCGMYSKNYKPPIVKLIEGGMEYEVGGISDLKLVFES